MELALTDTLAGSPGTNILAKVSVAASVVGPDTGFYFSSNKVHLEVGRTYAFVLTTRSVGGLIIQSSFASNQYPGGSYWLKPPDGPWQRGYSNLVFVTYVTPPIPPNVTLLSPRDGDRFDAQSPINLTAVADDGDDEVAGMAFYADDALIAAGPGSAVNVAWTNPPPGHYVISARATDEQGHTGTAFTTAAILVGPKNGLPTLSVSDAAGWEGPPGSGNVVFTFQLSEPSLQPVSFDYQTVDGSATAPADYAATAGTATLAPGTTSLSILVPIEDDSIDEKTETFFLRLSHATNAILLRSLVVGFIKDDDFGPGEVHHFVWGPLPQRAYTGLPFGIQIEAQDIFNHTVTDFAGPVTLSLATNFVAVPRPGLVQPAVISNFVSGVWTGSVAVLPLVANAHLKAEDVDGHFGNSSSFLTIPAADPGISISSPDLVTQGDRFVFNVVATNAGPSPAQGLIGRVFLPSTTLLLSARPTQGTLTNQPTLLRWDIGALDAGGQAALEVTVSPLNFGTVTCTALLSVAGRDLDLANNQARRLVIVNGRPIADAGPGQTVECAGTLTGVVLDGRGSADVDGDALSFAWRDESMLLGTNSILSAAFTSGTHVVALEVVDARGGRATNTVIVQVVDTTPPNLNCITNKAADFTDESGAIAEFQITAVDLCSPVTLVCAPASGSKFPIGVTRVSCTASDSASNLVSCSFPVTVLGPLGVHQEVLEALVALSATVTNRHDRNRLEAPITDLTRALESARWIDQTHLDRGKGKKVFDEDWETANKLEQMPEPENELPDDWLRELAQRLAQADRLLAWLAIQEARAAGLSAKKIAEDLRELSRGDRDYDRGESGLGVEHYRIAWAHAVHLQTPKIDFRPGLVQMQFIGLPRQTYDLQASTNLIDWETLGTSAADPDGVVQFSDPAIKFSPARFYRIQQE